MISIALDILILIFALLTYRDMKIKRAAIKQDAKDFVAIQLYRKNWKRERQSNDKTS